MTSKISDRLKVVIYSFDQPEWACAHIRILQYLRQWPSDIEIIYGVEFGDDGELMVNDSCVDTGDIFILQRFFPCLDTRDILNALWKSGKPVIYETDDLLTEILARAMQKPDHARMISDVIRKADLVTVSTQMLLDKYKPLSRNIKMIPNYIDEGLWVHKFLNKHDTDKLVIGYCGTPTHTGDLGIVEDALIQVLNKYQDKVILRMYGCGTERLNSLANVECREFSKNYFDYVYQSQKNSVDIAIAPIADNTFNLCKSNIKWLEYSARGIAGIFSDVGPYKTTIENGKTGVLVENTTSAWFEALELLIESDSLRKRLASNAQQFVHQHYSLNKDRVDYLTLLKNLVVDSQSRKDTDINPVKDINLQSLDTSLDMNEANDRYQLWIKQRQMSEIDGQIYAERMVGKWSCRPTFHIFCQTIGGGDAGLARTIQSLISQLYSQWSLTVISDTACNIDGLMGVENIVWLHSSNTTNDLNAALRDSGSDWVMLLKSGTLLEPNTLIEYADYINENQEWVCIYSDHDSYEYSDYYKDPFLKPDINKEYLFSMDYIGDAVAFKRQSVIDTGAYNNYKDYKNYDMLLRVISGYGSKAIGHIHNVLFHFYETATNYSESDHRAILNSYFSGKGVSVDILQGYLPETLRVIYQHKTEAMVSIIIPTRDMLEYLQPCVESIFERTVYKEYELIVVDNGSEDPDVFEFYQQMQEKQSERFRVIEFPFDFNYSAMINLGVEHSRGDYVLQLNNDTRVMQDEWLGRLMHHAQREEVGIVGAKLLFPGSGKIQHAGVFLGMHEIAGHPYMRRLDSKSPGYMNRAQVDQEFSAVTGACLLARKNIYQQVGGMDYESFKISYNDIDLCLKVKEAGYSVIWTAYSILLHHGSVSQVETHTNLEKKLQSAIRFRGEQDTMVDRWRGYIKNDPAYNRQLSLPEVIPQPDFTCVINWHGASKERPRILGMPVSGGSGEYRVKAPLRSLDRAGVAQIDYSYSPNVEIQRVLLLSELIRSEADAILVQNFLGDDSQDALEKYKKHADVFISYALDDLITHLPEGNECRKNIPANARTRLRKALKSCDRLIVSTEPLYDLCKNMIDDIVIIPNYLEPTIWADLHSSRSMATKPRVGWAGAHQHSDDLEFIEDVVKATAHEIDWIFFGMCPDNIRHHVSEIHGFELDFEKYAEKLASLNLDLAIAPLMQHPFNEAKSNLRLLEYGVMGWPVICTDIFPYQNAPVKRVRNDTTAWIDAIRERIYDLDAAYREGDQLREWVMSGHMLHQHVDIWSESLLSGEIKDSYRDVWQENKAILSQ